MESRPRPTTVCCRSWCPRWRRPLPSASRYAPVERPSLRQAVRTRRPAETSGGVAGPATPLSRCPLALQPSIPTPTKHPPPIAEATSPQPRRPPERGSLMPRCPLCRSALVTITFDLYPIAICTSCSARWIQDGHQQRAINQIQEPTLFALAQGPSLLAQGPSLLAPSRS